MQLQLQALWELDRVLWWGVGGVQRYVQRLAARACSMHALFVCFDCRSVQFEVEAKEIGEKDVVVEFSVALVASFLSCSSLRSSVAPLRFGWLFLLFVAFFDCSLYVCAVRSRISMLLSVFVLSALHCPPTASAASILSQRAAKAVWMSSFFIVD